MTSQNMFPLERGDICDNVIGINGLQVPAERLFDEASEMGMEVRCMNADTFEIMDFDLMMESGRICVKNAKVGHKKGLKYFLYLR